MTKSIQSNENILFANFFNVENEYNEHELKLIETFKAKRENLDSIQQKLDDGTKLEELQQFVEGLEELKPMQGNGKLEGFARFLLLEKKEELLKGMIEIVKYFSGKESRSITACVDISQLKKEASRPLVA